MEDHPEATSPQPQHPASGMPSAPRDRYGLHLLLFLLAFLTTCMAGAELVSNRSWLAFLGGTPESLAHQLYPRDLWLGGAYALCFLGFLTVHEFGHYLTARRLKVPSSLPYYLPLYLPLLLNIGTLGAVIRLRGVPQSRRAMFRIGIAGPIAGFAVSLLILVYGFTHLPDASYLYGIHPEYATDLGRLPTDAETVAHYAGTGRADDPKGPLLAVGTSLLFEGLQQLADPERLPNRFELIHYPLLWAGFLGLFFTALNLLPIGQLDGGHVVYGLFGWRIAGLVARLTVLALLLYGGLGLVTYGEPYWNLYLGGFALLLTGLAPYLLGTRRWQPIVVFLLVFLAVQQGLQLLLPAGFQGNRMWLLWALLGTRFIGLDHPRAASERPLTRQERWLGWLGIALFVLCFTPEPIYLVYNTAGASAVFTAAP